MGVEGDSDVTGGGRDLQHWFEEVLDLIHGGVAGNASYLRTLVTRRGATAIQAAAGSSYEVRGSTGMGSVADVPWVGVFPRSERASAQEGYYPVYLFKADGAAVYLSLLCGTENLPIRAVRKRAFDLRNAVGPQHDLAVSIDLGSKSERPRKYEAATAFAVRYEAGSIPEDAVLRHDLERLLDLRSAAAEVGLEFGAVEPQHLVLKWSPDREARSVAMARAIADEHGSVWWASPGGAGSAAMTETRITALQAQLADLRAAHRV
jgi:hypothetical protein